MTTMTHLERRTMQARMVNELEHITGASNWFIDDGLNYARLLTTEENAREVVAALHDGGYVHCPYPDSWCHAAVDGLWSVCCFMRWRYGAQFVG